MSGLLITATDTAAGKSVVCGQLTAFMTETGWDVTTQKWVQTGSGRPAEDMEVHRRMAPAAGRHDPKGLRCPYCFPLPASPHLAAAEDGASIEIEELERAFRRLDERHDAVLVEGVGGALVPLTEEVLVADLAARLGLAAVVVVPNVLGCINHSLLTAEALRSRDIPLLGFIFNTLPGRGARDEVARDNPRIVTEVAGSPLLGELPALDEPMEPSESFEPIGRACISRWKERTGHD
jgi:dethiobiotin synthetase